MLINAGEDLHEEFGGKLYIYKPYSKAISGYNAPRLNFYLIFSLLFSL
jgi:hypothetical protein